MKRIVSNRTYHSINLYTDLLLAECEVRTASLDRVFFFLLWPKREARGPWKQGRKKRGSITCRTDRANETNKMFIIWLCWLFRFWIGDRKLEVRTATYGPGIDQSQHAKSVSHIIKQLIHAPQQLWHSVCGSLPYKLMSWSCKLYQFEEYYFSHQSKNKSLL